MPSSNVLFLCNSSINISAGTDPNVEPIATRSFCIKVDYCISIYWHFGQLLCMNYPVIMDFSFSVLLELIIYPFVLIIQVIQTVHWGVGPLTLLLYLCLNLSSQYQQHHFLNNVETIFLWNYDVWVLLASASTCVVLIFSFLISRNILHVYSKILKKNHSKSVEMMLLVFDETCWSIPYDTALTIKVWFNFQFWLPFSDLTLLLYSTKIADFNSWWILIH